MTIIEQLADRFTECFYKRDWPGQLVPDPAELSLADAYEVQDQVVSQRVDRGERVAGFKVGCTSAAIRAQFGLGEPISGRLLYPHIHSEGTGIHVGDYVNCAIEPEMVFVIGQDLQGIDLPDDRLIEAIESVRPGIELHHFKFWFQPPTSQELICSGGIHAGLIVGDTQVDAGDLDFESEQFTVRVNGKTITQAPASEIMGGPLHSLRWLVNALTRRGTCLQAGHLVIPGSPVELVTIDEDSHAAVEVTNVGTVEARFTAT